MKVAFKRNQHGFTIVELLVVIVVIGILAAITIVAYTGIGDKAKTSSLQSDLSNATTQLNLFLIDKGNYPTTIDCGSADSNTNKCLKASSGNTFAYYQANISTTPQTFSLLITNGTTNYQVIDGLKSVIATPAIATGGTVTDDGRYRIHTFNTSGTLNVTTGGTAEVLVIGGGGGGGSNFGAGAGAGGYILDTNYTLTAGANTVTVGNGGTAGLQGGNSVFGTITATGGGYGAANGNGSGMAGGNGGSGGGGVYLNGIAGNGITGQGYNGGVGPPGYWGGGGGGGASGVGVGGDNYALNVGGPGKTSIISGSPVTRGGGGGAYLSNGGAGGGGGASTDGTANTGGGGGGGGWSGATGATGGSGVVIIRYLTP
jgi:prepilin-type N-terminal cleavage/methylation domain-containing protein